MQKDNPGVALIGLRRVSESAMWKALYKVNFERSDLTIIHPDSGRLCPFSAEPGMKVAIVRSGFRCLPEPSAHVCPLFCSQLPVRFGLLGSKRFKEDHIPQLAKEVLEPRSDASANLVIRGGG